MDAYQQQVYSERMQGKKHKEIDIVAIVLSIGMGLDSSATAGRPVQLHVHLYTSMQVLFFLTKHLCKLRM
jgi:hypothetical protein